MMTITRQFDEFYRWRYLGKNLKSQAVDDGGVSELTYNPAVGSQNNHFGPPVGG